LGHRVERRALAYPKRLRLSAAELTQTLENLLEYAAAAADTQAAARETVELSDMLLEVEPVFAASARQKKSAWCGESNRKLH
jgi:hypothetical protein